MLLRSNKKEIFREKTAVTNRTVVAAVILACRFFTSEEQIGRSASDLTTGIDNFLTKNVDKTQKK